MKITSIRGIAHRALGSDMRGDTRNYVYVKVETDEGLVGWGESSCSSLSVVNVIEEMGQNLVGEDPSRVERHWQKLYHLRHGQRGGILTMAAISGIDMALWDIKAKALGVPLYELLGGKTRDKLWCYGRFDGRTPEKAAAHAVHEVKRGLTALKGDPFRQQGPYLSARALHAAADTVLAVRDAVGPDVEILVEAHGRLTAPGSLQFLKLIEPARPYFLEEPVGPEDIESLAQIKAQTEVSIATGERIFSKWGFRDLLERRVVDVIQPDPANCGGITESRKIAALAEAHNTWVQFHNPFGPLNTLASAHLSSVIPNFLIMEVILEETMHNWFGRICKGGFPDIVDGHFHVPTAPGLGVEIDEDVLLAHPPVTGPAKGGFSTYAEIKSPQGIDW
jgi:galactonate dehydratase